MRKNEVRKTLKTSKQKTNNSGRRKKVTQAIVIRKEIRPGLKKERDTYVKKHEI